jgi:hypothetical protein
MHLLSKKGERILIGTPRLWCISPAKFGNHLQAGVNGALWSKTKPLLSISGTISP